ncbi:BfmA/BtgA family mobilization protein [Maribacter stanieri]|uniref:BfmA/BtgA family mobilization protein n=1 Tax=Maribacter stanieri TaxID=440514 RepID=UPI0024944868|nr:BfmA/BtgA family mobilization protein [Maribacter stanieri]
MDKGYENERFESVSIKTSVAQKFTKFCKKLSKSKSMTLLLMLEFFEENGISPYESIGPKMQTLEELIKKRINGVIAIMKDIEKNQTKPTVAMMQSLFEQAEPPKKNLILEKEIPQEKPRVKFVEREQKDNKL